MLQVGAWGLSPLPTGYVAGMGDLVPKPQFPSLSSSAKNQQVTGRPPVLVIKRALIADAWPFCLM